MIRIFRHFAIIGLLAGISVPAICGESDREYGNLGFPGTFSRQANGSFDFMMLDGSHLEMNPSGRLSIREIAHSEKARQRYDADGRVMFASDSGGFKIYTFRYNRDGSLRSFTDPEAHVFKFIYDEGKRVKEIYFPNRVRLEFP